MDPDISGQASWDRHSDQDLLIRDLPSPSITEATGEPIVDHAAEVTVAGIAEATVEEAFGVADFAVVVSEAVAKLLPRSLGLGRPENHAFRLHGNAVF